MTVLLTDCGRIGRDARGEIVIDAVARVTLTCCGATLACSPEFARAFAGVVDHFHVCVPDDQLVGIPYSTAPLPTRPTVPFRSPERA